MDNENCMTARIFVKYHFKRSLSLLITSLIS